MNPDPTQDTMTSSPLAATRAALALVTLLTTLALAAAASAGTYTVTGTCSAWTSFNHQPARLAAYPACEHLIARNVIGDFETRPAQAGAGWRFDVPAGTTIQDVKLNAYITGGRSWASEIFIVGSGAQSKVITYMGYCRLQEQCGKGVPYAGPTELNGAIVAKVLCVDDEGCPNSGTTPRASVDIAGSAVTLSDPSPPGVGIVGGSLSPSGWHGGQRNVLVSASDNTGIRAARALIDGDARHSTTNPLPCDYGRPVPCSNQAGASVEVDLRGVPDGQHALQGQAEDASGNAGNSGIVPINVDNTPPLAPRAARLVGGVGWRASNNFTVAWKNPAQIYSPIAGVSYQLCPQGAPDTSPGCQSGTLASTDISRLAFKVPGPGAWRIRLWLMDAAGNGVTENGVTIGGLGLLAGRKGRTRSHLKVGDRKHNRLRRKTSVALGRTVKIVGRLSAGKRRKGLRRKLLVYRRVSVQGARFKAVDRVRTTRRGRFTYRADAGPSRRYLFVYPGSNRVAGRIAAVDIRVRAKLGIGADDKRLRNGEAVTLGGRLRGGHIPPGGALLELQVFTRGKWRPFATPRTDKKGRWSYAYRFETVAGRAKFRFRAVLRKQPTYPYTAKSRSVPVRVRGL